MTAKLLASGVAALAAIGAAAVGMMPVAMASIGQVKPQTQPITRAPYPQTPNDDGQDGGNGSGPYDDIKAWILGDASRENEEDPKEEDSSGIPGEKDTDGEEENSSPVRSKL